MSAKTKANPPRRRPLTELMDRQPPFDLQAEIGVLGSIVLLPDVLDHLRPILKTADYYDDAHSTLYRQMLELHDAGKKIDPTLLVDRLKAAGEYEAIGGAAYLSKIVNAVPNAAHATYYAWIVAKHSERRRLIVAFTEGLQDTYDGDEPDEITDRLEAKLQSLGSSRESEALSISEVAAAAISEVEADTKAPCWPGCMSGLDRLDQAKGPILPGEVEVIAARPGNGKTSYAAQVAIHNAERGRSVLFVSMEMRATELVKRDLCSRAGLDSRDVRSGRFKAGDVQRILAARGELDGLPLRLWAPPAATLSDIRGMARSCKAKAGLQLLVIDYLGLVRPEADDRRLSLYERVTKTSAGLKALARELDVPIIALVQLNREGEKEEPRLSHLRDSGAIEQDADSVLFIHHPPSAKQFSGGEGVYAVGVHLIIAKHRHGERGRVSLLWHPRETRFSSPTSF
ncbi:MAG TPA: DnaB-like helicase C-terminal domain-containing protein [Pirellulaceae bacterium]|nr:DnaB-like helicase C-terminal domain-containing protein [Pirellulaceae bacterium]